MELGTYECLLGEIHWFILNHFRNLVYCPKRANVPPFPGDICFCLDKYAVEDWLYVVYLWHSQA